MERSRTVANGTTISAPLGNPARVGKPTKKMIAGRSNGAPSSKKRNGGAPVELGDVEAFAAVVDSGSFTAAAARLRAPKSALSRRVARLEESLGARLLQRTTRSLSLTEAGAAYHASATQALGQLREAAAAVSERSEEPSGTVRITMPVDVGSVTAIESLTEFVKQYPKVNVEVDLSARMVDLIAEGFDLALRAGPLRDSSLVARKLGDTTAILAASPDYLARRGAPTKPSDLADHDCVLFRAVRGESKWRLIGPEGEEEVSVQGRLSGSDFSFIRAAAIQGAGIAMLPSPAALLDMRCGTLVRVLPDYSGFSSPIHLVYPSARFLPARVTVLRDFLLKNLKINEVPACRNLKSKAKSHVDGA